MPFQVVDVYGDNIGVIAKQYWQPFDGNVEQDVSILMVALIDSDNLSVHINYQTLRKRFAELHECIGMFNRVKEEKLKEEMSSFWNRHLQMYGNYDEEFLLRYFAACDFRSNIEEHVKVQEQHVKGYVLFERSLLEIKDKFTPIKLDADVSYIKEPFNRFDHQVIYGKIVDYPVISIDQMSAIEGLFLGADLSDFGGRNHSHRTDLVIESGNYLKKISLPFQITAKKDTPILLNMRDKAIRSVYCDGMIYQLA